MESGSQSSPSVHEDGERGRAEEGRNVDPEARNFRRRWMFLFPMIRFRFAFPSLLKCLLLFPFVFRYPFLVVFLFLDTRALWSWLVRVSAPLQGPVRIVIRSCLNWIGVYIAAVVVFVIGVAFLVYRIPVAMILEGIVSLKQPPHLRQQQINDEISHHQDIFYRLGTLYERRRQKVEARRRVKAVLTIVLLVVFISLGIKNRRAMVLGFHLWNWMVLLGVFTCGIQISTLVLVGMYHVPGQMKDMAVVRSLEKGEGYRIICYYVYWLTDPILRVFYSATLLLAWLQCFFYKDKDNDNLSYGTWTFVCLLVGSVLLLIKTAFLLNWGERHVYHSFSDRIVRCGFQLYFLTHICGLYLSILELARNEYIRSKNEMGSGNGRSDRIIEEVIVDAAIAFVNDGPTVDEFRSMLSDWRKDCSIVPIKANLYDLRDIARCFIDLAIVSSGDHNHKDEDIDGIEQRFNEIAHGVVQYITEEDLITKFNFTQTDAPLFWQELLWQQLQDNSSQHNSSQLLQVSYRSFKKWMVDVHIRSITLGRTLRDSEGLVNYLNSIINGAIAIMVILVWLLLTEVATPKVFVVIASSFLAAAVIFGDMCKRVFEGIIFIFVSHPFSVGDTCEIENQKLEVKQMGVLRTKFYKVGTKEEISYANSELASKAIMNLKEDVGLEDQVTLKLDSPTASDSAIQLMKTKIKRFFENDKRRRYASNTELTTLEVTGNWIMIIKFKHQMASRDMTVTKCVELKQKQRSEFLEAVNQMCDETHIKLAVAPT